MPFVYSCMKRGVWTYSKQAVMPTSSGQNWATLFMGANPQTHGYTEWNSTSPSFPYSFGVKNDIFPTIFQVLRDQKPDSEIGAFFQWDNIKYYLDTLSLDYYKHIPLDNGHICITDSVCNYILNKRPNLCAIIYDDPDHTGHSSGFYSNDYYGILEILDTYINKIVQTVTDAGIIDETVFIITSDHGGIEKTHGGSSASEKCTPFIMFGKHVKRLGCLEQSVKQFDVAPIMAHILGLKAPIVWEGNRHPDFINYE